MASLVDRLPIDQFTEVNLSRESWPENDEIIDDNDNLLDQLSDRYEQSRLIHDDVCASTFVVLWLGEKHTSLTAAFIEYVKCLDITFIYFSTKTQLWYWLNTHSSVRIASLIIETKINIQNVMSDSHAYKNIRSILVRCETNELTILQRFSRSYRKIDGIFADDTRLLIKLIIDLALFSEEIGDQKREDENNELEAQRNYDRALKLCTLVQKI
ncbi:unnamed protein product [Rotaria sp. Silwood2]|nr:unnamed protein product [Rotaria sp. Silwood2]CAF2649546.1 unnamed protein product [Rotaria sp. Silwood2]CAF2905507.1 unnamed protein product [Rotaria sp. Silwood2]CAF3056625.1 unnamed protein product [Rotaria sp. Silwood2]CAF4466529.1 unnamed protein product [Rotaria sp. Silwood2]